MNCAEMRAAFWAMLGLTESQFVDASRISVQEVDDLIWRGILELYHRCGPSPRRLLQVVSIDVETGTETYSLPANFWKWSDTKPLLYGCRVEFAREGELDHVQAHGTLPSSYLYEAGGDSIGIRPVPTQDGTLKLYAVRKPVAFASYTSYTGPFADLVSVTDSYADLAEPYLRTPLYWAGKLFSERGIEVIDPTKVAGWLQTFDADSFRFIEDQRLALQQNQQQTVSLSIPCGGWD